MRFPILFIFSILLISSCKEKSTLQADVMAIHDEVMPKMGELHVAKKNLKQILIATDNDSLKAEIQQLINNLDEADEGMMNWMASWNVPSAEPELTAYLKSEKIKITKVKTDMLSSLEAANQYLSKTNQ